MGTYITQSSIENVYGTANVARWSNLAGGATADTDRIALAIAWAEAWVESRFRGHVYQVPFTGANVATIIVDWCATLAGIWLYRQRGATSHDGDADSDRYEKMEKRVKDEIGAVLAGSVRLDLTHSGTHARAPFVSGAP